MEYRERTPQNEKNIMRFIRFCGFYNVGLFRKAVGSSAF